MKKFAIILLSSFVFFAQGLSQNSALNFDGTNDYIRIDTNFRTTSAIPNSLTIEFWFKTTTTTASCFFGQSKYNIPTVKPTSFVPAISINSNGTIRAELWVKSSGVGSITSTTTYNDGKWHHIALAASYNNQILYIDGIQIGSRSGIIRSDYWWHNTQIGTGYDAGNRLSSTAAWKFVNAQIDEIRVWDTALTLSIIKDWTYRPVNSNHPFYSDLVGYYKLDEGTGTSANDSSGRNSDGTLMNFGSTPWVNSYAPFISTPSNYSHDIAATWPAKATSSSSIMSVSDAMSGNTYIVYAHNNNSINYNTSDKPSNIVKRLSRSWRVEKEGSLNGEITFDYAALDTTGFNTFKLLVASDTSFANASYLHGTKIGGYKITFPNVAFQDSFFYTIGAYDFQGPTVETYQINNIAAYSATIKGNVLDDGGLSTIRGVCWGTATNPDTTGNKTTSGTGMGIYSANLSNLQHSTTYHVRAYAINSLATVYGADSSFVTPTPAPATVWTNGVLAIYTDSASVSGKVTHDGNLTVTERGFCWSTSMNPTADLSSKLIKGSGKGSFTGMITNLSPNTNYHYRAYAINSMDTSYGGDSVLTTLPISIPTVTTGVVSTITGYSASVSGNCSFDGRRPVTARGVVWDTASFPSISLSTKTDVGSGIGSINSNLSGLQPNTTYHVRAYATNSVGTAYGHDTSFLTAAQPNVEVNSFSSISYYSANVQIVVTSDGRMPVTSRGVCYSTSANPDYYGTKVIQGSGTGSVIIALSGLTANTVYHVRAFAINAVDTAYSADSTFKTQQTFPPVVSTKVVANILATSAICGGVVSIDGGASVTERGICWSKIANPKANLSTKLMIGSGLGSFSGTMTNLQKGTLYHVRAYAINNVDTSYGGDSSFTTIGGPTVSTDGLSNIGPGTAQCGGTVLSNGGSIVISRGVCWSTLQNPTAKLPTKTTDGYGLGHFTSSLSGLSANKTYYVRAYAINSVDTAYGNEVSFVTPKAPEVQTLGISMISGNTAKIEGSVISGTNITERGIAWSKYPNPSTALTTKNIEGSGLGTFSSTITGLDANTTYHVRAYAINSVGTSYGGDSSFLTAAKPVLTTYALINISSTTADCGGEITSDGRMPVTARGVCWSNNPEPIASLSTKTTDGSGIGKFSSFITGLQSNKTYYVRAYAVNDVDTAYGNEESFEITPPVAITNSAGNITIDGVELSGIVNANGQLSNVYFEYGLTTAYGSNAAGTPNNLTSTVDESITAIVGSLISNREYHYRIVAESNHGITFGADSIFNTLNNSVSEQLHDADVTIITDGNTVLIRLMNNETELIEARVLDLLGNIIYKEKFKQETNIKLTPSASVYLVHLIVGNRLITKKIMLD